MSRGVFRHFLRYILLTVELWETRLKPRSPIDIETVKKAITTERLADDMELELVELFPKRSGLRLEAVRLLMHLEESGPEKQSELAKSLGIEAYSLSGLLTKLEHSRYVTRTAKQPTN
jgi:DNA-binding MarR family transcriptional regulator